MADILMKVWIFGMPLAFVMCCFIFDEDDLSARGTSILLSTFLWLPLISIMLFGVLITLPVIGITNLCGWISKEISGG